MAKRKLKKATSLFKDRKLKVRVTKKMNLGRKPSILVDTPLPHNAEVIRTQAQLDVLFTDIRRAQKVSGKEIIIIWLR